MAEPRKKKIKEANADEIKIDDSAKEIKEGKSEKPKNIPSRYFKHIKGEK